MHLTCGIFWFLRAKSKQTNKLYENFGLAKQCFFTLGAKNVQEFFSKENFNKDHIWLIAFQKAECPLSFVSLEGTVYSLYCGHRWDLVLVSSLARVRNNGSSFQSNVCNLFLPGIWPLIVFLGVHYSEVSARRGLTVFVLVVLFFAPSVKMLLLFC